MIVICRRSVVYCLLLLLALLTAILLCHGIRTIPALAPEEIPPTIIIDAGHGGADGGAVSAEGVVESTLNLQIARKVEGLLCFLGQNTVMTRTGTEGLYDPDSTTIRQKKVADTRNRVQLINSYENAVLISIHQNSLPGAPKVCGAQVFYNSRPHAKELAATMQGVLNDSVNIGNPKTETAISKSVYIMSHVNCDAVLVECGFLSNSAEAELLQQPDYQRKLAAAIVSGYLTDKG